MTYVSDASEEGSNPVLYPHLWLVDCTLYSPEIPHNKSVILHQEVAENAVLSFPLVLSLSVHLSLLSVLIRMRARNVNPALILSGLIGRIVDNPGITEFQQKTSCLLECEGQFAERLVQITRKRRGARRRGGRMVLIYVYRCPVNMSARECLCLRLHLVARERKWREVKREKGVDEENCHSAELQFLADACCATSLSPSLLRDE